MSLINEKDIPLVISLYQSGKNYREVADHFGCGNSTIYEILRKHNIRKNRKEITPETEAKVINDYKAGATVSELSIRYNHHTYAISSALHKNNIKVTNPGHFQACKTYTNLTDNQIEIINGLLLSDGCCRASYKHRSGTKTPYFTVTTIHKEFDDHIRKSLPFIWNTTLQASCKRKICSDKFSNVSEVRQVFSRVDLCFHKFRSEWYPNGIKIVPRNLILTPTVVKYWFYGDGYSTYSYDSKNEDIRRVRIGLCTNGFTMDDCEFLIDRFKTDVGILFNIQLNRDQPRLVSNRYDTITNFFNYIGNSDLECFAYKWKFPSEPIKKFKVKSIN